MRLVLEWEGDRGIEREYVENANILPPVGTTIMVERKEPFRTDISVSKTTLKIGKYEWEIKLGSLQARTVCEVIKSEFQKS